MNIFGINFWVLFLIASGIIIVISQLFNSKLSVIRVLFGVLFILCGTSIIVNGFSISGNVSNIIFSSEHISPNDTSNRYAIVFGNGTIDLSQRQARGGSERIGVDTIFGNSTILIGKDTPVNIKGNNVFGSINMPDGHKADVINNTRYTQGDTASPDCLNIEVNSIFSSVRIQLVE